MTNTMFGLKNQYALAIAAMTVVHIVLNVFFLHTWWSMVVFMILSATSVMEPDLFLTILWAGEVCTAATASFGFLKGRSATAAFIFWSTVVVVVGVTRVVRKKGQQATKP